MAAADPFVGRSEELSQLSGFFEDAKRGVARVALVAGEPGIGKTRLLEELARTLGERATVVWGRSWDEGVAPAYWPWTQVFRMVAPALIERLRGPAAGTDPESRFALFEGVASGLREAGARQPLVVLLDDVHAADPSSLSLLRFIARELRDAHVLVIAAYRDAEARTVAETWEALSRIARDAPTIELPRLLDDEVRTLLDGMDLGAALGSVASYIVATTEGVPLFVHEVLRSMSSPESLLASTTPLPDGVRGVIRQRLARLAPTVRELLERASVVGQTFTVGLVAVASEATAVVVEDAMDAAMRADVLRRVGPGRYAFAHTLVREVLYRDILGGERARIHARIADALERGATDAERSLLAHHALRAAPVIGTQRAVDAAIAAARVAAAMLAFEDAKALLARATAVLDLAAPDPDVRARLASATAEIHGRGQSDNDAAKAPPPIALSNDALVLSHEGDVWTVSLGARAVRLKDMRGLHLLARLVASPGEELHVLALSSGASQPQDGGDAGALLDREAVTAYRARLADLEDELREAEAWNDVGRGERARGEIERLRRELSRAIGLGGRERRAGAAVERARVNVTRRLRDVVHRIAEHDEGLGRYLDATLHTGTYCSYRPA